VDAAGRETRCEYDERGRLLATIFADGSRSTATYDALGRQLTPTNAAGRTTTYSYDAEGQLVGVTDAEGGVTQYGYGATAAAPRTTRDARDRRLTKATPAGTLAYTYDSGGNLTSIRSSNAGGVHVEYAWDTVGQLTTVTDRRATSAVATHTYSAAGQMTSVALPTGVQATYGRDGLDRVTGLSWRAGGGGGSTLASYAYTLGASGHRLSIVEASGRRVDYRYDDAHQLVGETMAGPGAAGAGTIG
jgi:YD repeat-containing protein